MPMRAKAPRPSPGSTPRRRTTAVSPRAVHRHNGNGRAHHDKHAPSPYAKAMRYLHSLADFERLRIVRYNNINFNLNRMRLLLKKLGNPQDKFRSVHIAGTKGKGSTC